MGTDDQYLVITYSSSKEMMITKLHILGQLDHTLLQTFEHKRPSSAVNVN